MTKKIDKNKKNMKEPDFKKYDPLAQKIKDTMGRIDQEESKISMSSLDDKFLEKLDQSGMTDLDKLSVNIEKCLSKKRK